MLVTSWRDAHLLTVDCRTRWVLCDGHMVCLIDVTHVPQNAAAGGATQRLLLIVKARQLAFLPYECSSGKTNTNPALRDLLQQPARFIDVMNEHKTLLLDPVVDHSLLLLNAKQFAFCVFPMRAPLREDSGALNPSTTQ